MQSSQSAPAIDPASPLQAAQVEQVPSSPKMARSLVSSPSLQYARQRQRPMSVMVDSDATSRRVHAHAQWGWNVFSLGLDETMKMCIEIFTDYGILQVRSCHRSIPPCHHLPSHPFA